MHLKLVKLFGQTKTPESIRTLLISIFGRIKARAKFKKSVDR